MSAFEQGCKEGRMYITRFPIQTITLDGYRIMGRTTSSRRYSQPKAQDAYLNGWVAISGQFQSLFKPDDQDTSVILAKIDVARQTLEARRVDMEKMLGWREDDAQLQSYLHGAYRAIEDAQDYLNDLVNVLKERETR